MDTLIGGVKTVLGSGHRGADTHAVCQKMKRNKRPSAASLDSQSSKTSACGGEHRSFDGGKQVKGRKRFILTARRPGDTQGLLLAVWICAAGVSEKAGAMQLLRYVKAIACLHQLCSRIELVWAAAAFRFAV